MKKIIYLLFVVCSMVASSCADSDEIAIVETQSKYQAVFKINPATVVKPFTWEFEAGELTTIDANSKLRVRALVYNTEGNLMFEKTEQFSNYNVVMNFTTELESGNYTVIAISDVINPNNSEIPEYWTLKDYSNLSTATVSETGWIGYARNILGIQNMAISVTENSNEFKIDIQPAGSVMYTWYFNIHSYDDIKRYQLDVNQIVKQGLFDSNGKFDIVLENRDNEFNWRESVIYPDNSTVDNIYAINYLLPQKNLRLRFCSWTGLEEDDDAVKRWLGEEILIPSVGIGEEYFVSIDLSENDDKVFPVEFYNVTGLTFPNLEASKSFLRSSRLKEGQMITTKDFVRISNVK